MRTRRILRRARVSNLAEPLGRDEANLRKSVITPIDLDIDTAILMKAKPLKTQKTDQASQEHRGIKRTVSRRPPDALIAAVGCEVEDTTGSQPQEPPKPKKPKKKDPAPPAPSSSE